MPTVWMNGAALDRVFSAAAEESARYHERWFYQANSRPAYATPAVYQAMAQALVARERKQCHVWEVENEPNFNYTPENYVDECLIPFAKGAKAADPGCVIMGPGCVSLKQTLEFMDVIYRRGANRWLDNVSTHAYPGPGESWEQFGNTATIPELRRWMAAHGDGSKTLWQTEQGYAWDNSGKAQSARYTVRQFLEGARLGVAPDHQYYFYPQAHGFEDWYLSASGEAGSEQSWLPSGAALRFFAENLNGFQFAGDVPSPYKGIFLARFTRQGESVIAAWTFDFNERLPVRISGAFSAVEFMGNPLKLTRSRSGEVVLPLSGEPIYIHLAKGAELMAPGSYGPDLALAASGAAASASSSSASHPAPYVNDGNWQLWENVIGLPGRTAWQSGEMNPTPSRPDWLQVTFPKPRVINRIVALCYLPAVSASPRDFEFQARIDGQWRTVAVGKNEATWVFNRTFPAVRASAVRLEITAINDGWQGDRRWMPVLMGDASHYTDSKVLVSELEA
ncbi:MAG: discoidin domain-containing protein, partial [Chloroflexi bacterium]|nr:discoidin domain-containing protein [Chloroflexota bacterium]